MSDTIDILKKLALQVRNAADEGENTAERVGRVFVGILEYIQNLETKVEDDFWKRNFDERKDNNTNEYLFIRKPIVVDGGGVFYAGEELSVDSIFKGLPLDTTTLQWVDGVLTVVGGTGGGTADSVAWGNVTGKPTWISDTKPSYSFTEITGLAEELGKYVTLSTDQSVTGMKDFENGMKVSGVLFKVINGVLTLDCSIAVTGGVTVHALGEQTAATVMDGLLLDGDTLAIGEDGKLTVVGGTGGASNWDELEGKPSWITDTKPVYTWGEITSKPTTLSGYGIQASDVLNVLKTVDGSGSGLDADTLDGKHYNDIINGNVASATKLQTARTIWGQSFDGTKNIIGSLTSVTDITGTGTFTGANIKATDSVYVNGIRLHKTIDGAITIEGNLLVTGGITAYADGEDSGGTGGGVTIIDNLTSTLTDAALSANQGRILKGLIDSKVSNWGELEGKPTTIAGYGITDAYTKTDSDNRFVNVSGDTMTGHLIINGSYANILTISDTGKTSALIEFKNQSGILGYIGVSSEDLNFRKTNTSTVYKVWHAGNDGHGSGLDADMLDGLHESSFSRRNDFSFTTDTYVKDWVKSNGDTQRAGNIFSVGDFSWAADSTLKLNDSISITRMRYSALSIRNGNVNSPWQQQALIFLPTYCDDKMIYLAQMYTGGTGGNPATYVVRYADYDTIINGNVYSATKLQTARTIWGQSFDGTANINGRFELDGVSQGCLSIFDNNSYRAIQTYQSKPLSINPLGNNVGIGTTSPSQKLHVAGNILATGGGTFYSSDIRAKTIIDKPKLGLNSIANAPVIKFKWNGYNNLKDDGKLHIGGIAQYIEKILPECVIGKEEDFLSFDYAATGYVFSVLTARHLLSYETRTDRIIRKLKERIKRLERQLNIENHEEVCIMAD